MRTRFASRRLRSTKSNSRRTVGRNAVQPLEERVLLASVTTEDLAFDITPNLLDNLPYTPVADYVDDFAGNPATPGWSYWWNENGAIGSEANYSNMLYNGTIYDADGINNGLPDGGPLQWGSLGPTGGHAGAGSTQAGAGIDRYVIPTFTVADDGYYRITNSVLQDTNGGCGNGVDLRVYVNDDPTKFFDLPNGHADMSFDHDLGALSAGDNVYVAIGPKDSDGCDGFGIDYTIEQAATVTSVGATSASGAATSLNANGTVAYDPTAAAALQATNAGDNTADSVTYNWDDGNGGTGMATATVNVRGNDEVAPINATTNENRPINISVNSSVPGAVTLADYQDDFQGPNPNEGWNYLWNADGPIGDPANYGSMIWEGDRYDYNGIDGIPDANPLAWGFLSPTGGHPGTGSAQGGSGGVDRFVIASYDVPLDGYYQIGDSFFNRGAGTGNAELVVHVNDNAPVVQTTNTVANQSFNAGLGLLTAGDTVYVAYGPAGTDGSDGFGWDFSIDYVPYVNEVVGDYRDDFQGGAPAADWQYVWNANGPIGDPANYSDLNWNGSQYDFDGNAGVPDADPLAWGNLTPTGGHPGRGVQQAAGGVDRFVIAGYTVPTDGVYDISDSFYNRGNGNNGEVQLVIHVNDEAPLLIDYSIAGNQPFDLPLGELSAGDTVYLGVGPNLSDGGDSFGWDFSITRQQVPGLVTGVNPSTEGANVSLNSDGTINYDPSDSPSLQALNPGDTLNDTFTYTVQTITGDTSTATVTVSVNGTGNITGPVADVAAAGEDAASDIDVTANDGSSVIVADYVDDFQGPVAAPGWNYMWNSLTPVGQPEGYASMAWEGDAYDFNGVDGIPDLDPLAWGFLGGGGGHTGRGINDGGGTLAGGFDRAVIAAYTVPHAGNYEIVNSTFGDGNGGIGNLELTVHVEDEAAVVSTTNDSNGKAFDTALGQLDAGDTIYVALGPNTADGGDGFNWDFSIQFNAAPVVTAVGASSLGAAVSINGNGTINYDPTAAAAAQALYAGETADDPIDYTVTFSDGSTEASTVTVTVTGANDGPTAVNDPNATANEDDAPQTIDVLANDNEIDVDGNAPDDSISVTGITQGANGGAVAIGPGGANVTYGPDGMFESLAEGDTATDTFSYTISDQLGAMSTATVSVEITGQNDAPTADAGGPYNAAEGMGVILVGNFTDVDNGDTHTFSWTIDGNVVSTDQSPTLTWADLEAAGADGDQTLDVELTVTDMGGAGIAVTSMTTIDIANVAPTVTIAGATVADAPPTEGVLGIPIEFTFSASDPSSVDQSAGFTYSIVCACVIDPTPADPSASPLGVGLTFQDFGTQTISVTATDKDGGTSVVATHDIEIVPVAVVNDNLQATGTPGSDVIIFYPSSGGMRVRYNSATYPLSGGAYSFGGNIVANGEAGSDRIIIAQGVLVPAELNGGTGNDYLAGGIADDILAGGEGNDVILAGEGNNSLDGGDGNDRLEGRSGTDVVFGGAGNDRLNGGAGNDILDGGSGADFLFGGLGNDLLAGRMGIDNLSGHVGNDIVLGGDDSDQIFGGRDQDLLIGGAGVDRVRGDGGDDSVIGNTTDLDAALESALDDLALGTPLPMSITDALSAWFTSQDRTLFGGLNDDGVEDDLTGGDGVDEFNGASDRVRDLRTGDSIV